MSRPESILMDPAVSIIIPTYNRADLIGETLQSVLGQTYQSFEIIVVDDGSRDGTEKVVAALGDPRIRYFWKTNSGLPAPNRNVAIRMSRGRYIAFLDSDDLWLPEKLAIQIQWMEAHPNVGLTCTNALGFDGTKPAWRLNKISLVRRRTLSDLLQENFIANLTVVVRRECLDRVGLFNEDPQLRALEDYELWIRIAACYPFAYLPSVTARYRVHERNLETKDAAITIQRTIAMLRLLAGTPGLHPAELRRGIAVHYRLLARAHALAGNQPEYYSALFSSWQLHRSWKTFVLLVWYFFPGFHATRWMTAVARKLKRGMDYVFSWFSQVLKEHWAQ